MIGRIFESASRIVFPQRFSLNVLVQTRTKMKSHKSSAKRFIKTGSGIKRKQAGRNHGNGGFSTNSLRHLDSFVPVTNKANHYKKMDRYLPSN